MYNNRFYFDQTNLTKFVSSSFIPSFKFEELDQIFTDVESSSKVISKSTVTEDQEQITIPSKKFKEWSASFWKA